METGHQQREADSGNTPRPSQDQQQGVIQGGEDESWDGQKEPEQSGGHPGVQRQGRQEERYCCLTQRYCLKDTKGGS